MGERDAEGGVAEANADTEEEEEEEEEEEDDEAEAEEEAEEEDEEDDEEEEDAVISPAPGRSTTLSHLPMRGATSLIANQLELTNS